MKNCYIFGWLLCIFIFNSYLYGSFDNSSHNKLHQYVQETMMEQKRVKDFRNELLVTSAQALQKGITRKDLKSVRINLRNGLVKQSCNQEILTVLQNIERNHQRSFPCCCKPWVFQGTLNREALALRKAIDAVLMRENPELYEISKQNLYSAPQTAVPVQYSSSLEEELLQQVANK